MAREIEAKFYIQNPDKFRRHLEAQGARLKEPRVREMNLRFDTPQRDLGRDGRVLRLRQDTRARITYKDAGRVEAGAINRRELEFAVDDFDAAREFLEALGYEVALTYEKYRTTYQLDEVELMLDEMPYGNFVEIEGAEKALGPTAERLGLRWEAAIPGSYSQLFDHLRARRRLSFRDLTFDNLRDVHASAADLGVRPADE